MSGKKALIFSDYKNGSSVIASLLERKYLIACDITDSNIELSFDYKKDIKVEDILGYMEILYFNVPQEEILHHIDVYNTIDSEKLRSSKLDIAHAVDIDHSNGELLRKSNGNVTLSCSAPYLSYHSLPTHLPEKYFTYESVGSLIDNLGFFDYETINTFLNYLKKNSDKFNEQEQYIDIKFDKIRKYFRENTKEFFLLSQRFLDLGEKLYDLEEAMEKDNSAV